MYSEILKNIQTADDVAILESELDLLKASLFDSKNNFDSVLSNRVRKNIAVLIAKDIEINKVAAQKYIDGLLVKLDSLTIINLTLAYEPDNQAFASIYQWFVDNVGEEVVLDIYTNPNLLGGIQVSYNGKYYDGSLVSKVNQISQNRSKTLVNNTK